MEQISISQNTNYLKAFKSKMKYRKYIIMIKI